MNCWIVKLVYYLIWSIRQFKSREGFQFHYFVFVCNLVTDVCYRLTLPCLSFYEHLISSVYNSDSFRFWTWQLFTVLHCKVWPLLPVWLVFGWSSIYCIYSATTQESKQSPFYEFRIKLCDASTSPYFLCIVILMKHIINFLTQNLHL